MKERIESLQKDLGMSQTDFALKCGIPVPTLASMGDTLSAINLRKVVLAFDDLNARWLLTGQGGMWMSKEKTGTTGNDQSEIIFLRELVKSQQDTILLLLEKMGIPSQSAQI